MQYYNHLKFGYNDVYHKGVSLVTSLNSITFESFLNTLDKLPYDVGYIPPGFEHRADLISNLFYNTPTYDWLILQYNNIADPFQGLNIGDRLLIPILS